MAKQNETLSSIIDATGSIIDPAIGANIAAATMTTVATNPMDWTTNPKQPRLDSKQYADSVVKQWRGIGQLPGMKPLMVQVHEKDERFSEKLRGSTMILHGHCTKYGLQKLHKDHPVEYAAMFPDASGPLTDVYTDSRQLTEESLDHLLNDHNAPMARKLTDAENLLQIDRVDKPSISKAKVESLLGGGIKGYIISRKRELDAFPPQAWRYLKQTVKGKIDEALTGEALAFAKKQKANPLPLAVIQGLYEPIKQWKLAELKDAAKENRAPVEYDVMHPPAEHIRLYNDWVERGTQPKNNKPADNKKPMTAETAKAYTTRAKALCPVAAPALDALGDRSKENSSLGEMQAMTDTIAAMADVIGTIVALGTKASKAQWAAIHAAALEINVDEINTVAGIVPDTTPATTPDEETAKA